MYKILEFLVVFVFSVMSTFLCAYIQSDIFAMFMSEIGTSPSLKFWIGLNILASLIYVRISATVNKDQYEPKERVHALMPIGGVLIVHFLMWFFWYLINLIVWG